MEGDLRTGKRQQVRASMEAKEGRICKLGVKTTTTTTTANAAKPRKWEVRRLATVIRRQHLGGAQAQVLFDEQGRCFAENMDGGYSSWDRHQNDDYLLSELDGAARERAVSMYRLLCYVIVTRGNE